MGQAAAKRPIVLFVEDEEILREVIAQSLQDEGYDVRDAANAEQKPQG